MKPVYLDYNATTPLDPRVFEAMRPHYLAEVGNAGSRTHLYGQKAKDAVEIGPVRGRRLTRPEAGRDRVHERCDREQQSRLARIDGITASANERRHVLASCIEHRSVLAPLERLRSSGFDVELVPVTAGGYVEPDEVRRRLRPDTLLVSIMHANNETGVLQPVLEVARLLADSPRGSSTSTPHRRSARRLTNSGSSTAISSRSAGTRSTARPGSGRSAFAVAIAADVTIEPLMRGGGQERGLRPGTLPVPLDRRARGRG